MEKLCDLTSPLIQLLYNPLLLAVHGTAESQV